MQLFSDNVTEVSYLHERVCEGRRPCAGVDLMQLSRRDFIKAMAVASSGLLPLLPTGCGGRATDDSVPSVSTVRKTLHADLSHLVHWPAIHLDNVVLRVGGRTHVLAVHTADTYERFFRGSLGERRA